MHKSKCGGNLKRHIGQKKVVTLGKRNFVNEGGKSPPVIGIWRAYLSTLKLTMDPHNVPCYRDQQESRWSLGIDIFCPVSVSTSIRFPSLDESQSWHPRNFSVSMSLSLNIQEISQSQWVSVLTSKKFLSLDESLSQHPRYFSVLSSLGIDIQEIF